jgi:hypothetical protein
MSSVYCIAITQVTVKINHRRTRAWALFGNRPSSSATKCDEQGHVQWATPVSHILNVEQQKYSWRRNSKPITVLLLATGLALWCRVSKVMFYIAWTWPSNLEFDVAKTCWPRSWKTGSSVDFFTLSHSNQWSVNGAIVHFCLVFLQAVNILVTDLQLALPSCPYFAC